VDAREDTMDDRKRGTTLTLFAIAFALLAVSNFLKPLQLGGDRTGFVFFGIRLAGMANTLMGPLFGVLLAVYAYGVWNMRRFALPISHAYATYVIVNLIVYSLREPPADAPGGILGGVLYVTIAVGVSLGAALILTKRKGELR
jgi:hypothetical protein